jgi:hypothetical protein
VLSLLVRGRTTLRIEVAVIASPASEHAKGQESREYLDSMPRAKSIPIFRAYIAPLQSVPGAKSPGSILIILPLEAQES